MARWGLWLGIGSVVLLCGFGTAIVAPVFMSAKAAARMAVEMASIKRFERALADYADRHGGRLPGKEWKRTLLGVDPSLAPLLDRREEGWSDGLAAVPGVLGKRLDAFPPEAILFVGYHAPSGTDLDVLERLSDIGDAHRADRALALTEERVMGGGFFPPYESTATIGYRLAVQGVRLSR